MRLDLASFPIHKAIFGDNTELAGAELRIDKQQLIALLSGDPSFAAVDVEIAHPGESVRITQITDVIEPRIKIGGPGDIFPGLLGPVETVGSGRTNRLAGLALMTSGEVPWLGARGLFVPRDTIVDMAGPGADLTPHSQTVNVVLKFEFAGGRTHEDYERALLFAGVKAARYLAATTIDLNPPQVDTFDTTPADPSLRKVLYAYQVQSQGVFMRTYLYGRLLDELLPTLLEPGEILDGALIAAGLGGWHVKLSTWLHQNNPIITGLLRRHGSAWNFGGVILNRGHYYVYEDKQRVAIQIAKLAQMVGAAAVVFTLGGGGNNITEVMLAIQNCERLGIKTVLLTWEHCGPDGASYSLPFAVPEAVAMVSAGTVDDPIELPRPLRIIGQPSIRIRPEVGGVRLDMDQALTRENRSELYGGANAAGWQKVGIAES